MRALLETPAAAFDPSILAPPASEEPVAPRPRRARAKAAARPAAKTFKDPQLVFILARQSVLRGQFAARCLQSTIGRPADRAALRMEIELGLMQLQSVSARLQPLSRSRTLAVRFEAEEVLARLATIRDEMEEAQLELMADAPGLARTALQVRDRLMAKLRSGRG